MENKLSRRDFIGWVIKGGLLATFSGFIMPALSYLWPVMGHGPSTELQEVGNETDIPVWGSKKVIVAGSAILLIRQPSGYKAFSAICTHLGCIVDWESQKKEIVCPCHAGVFDVEGRNVAGPPPRPLPAYTVSVANGKIYVKI